MFQAAAAAAERRARDDAGCACGAKGGTLFTEAEVIQLESQPSSAAAQQEEGSREPGLQQLGDAEQNKASAARMQGQMGIPLDGESPQGGEYFERHVPQQRGGVSEEKQAREEVYMQEPIDLTADSDIEAEVLD